MLLEIEKLVLSLGGTPILRNVNLSLEEGEIYGLLGPNGAGKSTTIAVALGLLKPDAGQVRALGKDPLRAAHEIHRHLGVLPERNGFYDWMTADDYLAFFAALYRRGLSRAEIRKRISAVGLNPAPHQKLGTFSQGMRQRLGLARALIPDPRLMILDEPTNGLDPRGRREIHDILLKLADRGVGILLCTHILDDVERLCSRAGILVEGRSVAEGPIADLVRENDQRPRFRLRLAGAPPDGACRNEFVTPVAHEGESWIVDLDPATTPDTAWRELFFSGWPIAEIRREGGGLEDLYLTLTQGKMPWIRQS